MGSPAAPEKYACRSHRRYPTPSRRRFDGVGSPPPMRRLVLLLGAALGSTTMHPALPQRMQRVHPVLRYHWSAQGGDHVAVSLDKRPPRRGGLRAESRPARRGSHVFLQRQVISGQSTWRASGTHVNRAEHASTTCASRRTSGTHGNFLYYIKKGRGRRRPSRIWSTPRP